jgi:hypothetical protein
MESRNYEDAGSRRTYYQPRTMKDFYHSKWTDYEKPKWYHPYNGLDWRSEYMYGKAIHNRNSNLPPRLQILINFLDSNRLLLYLVIFMIADFLRY